MERRVLMEPRQPVVLELEMSSAEWEQLEEHFAVKGKKKEAA